MTEIFLAQCPKNFASQWVDYRFLKIRLLWQWTMAFLNKIEYIKTTGIIEMTCFLLQFMNQYRISPSCRHTLRRRHKWPHLKWTNFSFLKKHWCCAGGRVKHVNLVLSNELIKVELSPWKIWKADVSSVRLSSEHATRASAARANLMIENVIRNVSND